MGCCCFFRRYRDDAVENVIENENGALDIHCCAAATKQLISFGQRTIDGKAETIS